MVDTKELACRTCLERYGLTGTDLDAIFMSQEEFFRHLERDHHIMVKHDGETNSQARKRFLIENPSVWSESACRCEACRRRNNRGTLPSMD